eukprot:g13849.t1
MARIVRSGPRGARGKAAVMVEAAAAVEVVVAAAASSDSSSSSPSRSSDSSRAGGGGGGGDGGREFSPGDEGEAGGSDGDEPGDPGGDGSGGDIEELKYDPADARYPSGVQGKKLLRSASSSGPLRHGLEPGRTRRQTREMQDTEEVPGLAEAPDPEEALLATVIETGGAGIVEEYICDSLVQEQWEEEQERRAEEQTRRMVEMCRRDLQTVLDHEEQAFKTEVDASGSSQPQPDPQLSIPSPIGQKPCDVEALPMTYKDVTCSKVLWDAAVKKEIDGQNKVGTFTKVKGLPKGRKAIGAKWIFSGKTNEKGLITDFKARMVARGFSQIPGIDYHHSSSACPAASSIKSMFAVTNEKGKRVAHWDVKQAYIHAKLKEEISLRLPEGCGSMSGKVVKVERALYGLKQSGRPKRDDEPAVDKPVREAIGCLMWTKLTRPDIALLWNKLQRVAHSPTERIWEAVVRIMSYLNYTKDFGITYVRGSGLDLSVT